jgi:hypothetical protein
MRQQRHTKGTKKPGKCQAFGLNKENTITEPLLRRYRFSEAQLQIQVLS